MTERGLLLPKAGRQACRDGTKTRFSEVCRDQTAKPRHQVGDLLYLQEPYQIDEDETNLVVCKIAGMYLDTNQRFELFDEFDIPQKLCKRKFPYRKTSSRLMYKSLARTWFKCTEAGVQLLQDISHDDCVAEGIRPFTRDGEPVEATIPYKQFAVLWPVETTIPYKQFAVLWDATAKPEHRWEKNPWIFWYKIEKVKK